MARSIKPRDDRAKRRLVFAVDPILKAVQQVMVDGALCGRAQKWHLPTEDDGVLDGLFADRGRLAGRGGTHDQEDHGRRPLMITTPTLTVSWSILAPILTEAAAPQGEAGGVDVRLRSSVDTRATIRAFHLLRGLFAGHQRAPLRAMARA